MKRRIFAPKRIPFATSLAAETIVGLDKLAEQMGTPRSVVIDVLVAKAVSNQTTSG